MGRGYRRKTDPKLKSVPSTFRPGFLAAIDQRTDLGRVLQSHYQEIVADLGGPQEITRVKRTLIEKYVWMMVFLETLESDMATGKASLGETLGKWTQTVNALSGLAVKLGLERKVGGENWKVLTMPTTEPEPVSEAQ